MISAVSEYVDERAIAVVDKLSQGARTVFVAGEQGGGRSSVLTRSADILRQNGWCPVLISPPERQMDTASLALIDCGVGLAGAQLIDGELRTWTERAGWRQRTDQLRTWLAAQEGGARRLVLLCDDVAQWAIPEATETAQRAEFTVDLFLREAPCRKVIVGRPTDAMAERITIDLPELSRLLLQDEEGWGPLWEMVQQVGSQLPLRKRSPTHIGILIAHAALISVDEAVASWSPTMSTERLADRLISALAGSRRLRPFWHFVLTASLPRRPVPADWLASAWGQISDEAQRAVIDQCLVSGGDRVRLIRECRAATWRRPDDHFSKSVRQSAASRFLELYLSAFDTSTAYGDPEALQHGAEALYMIGRVGDPETIGRVAPNFSDQLDGIGILAAEREDWVTAQTAFGLAIEWDPDDAFAHHHLAYALDADAVEPRRIEREYVRALQLDPRHATWHARLISFLVVRARTQDARTRWDESRATLSANDGDGPLQLYEKLHLPVAANLLRRSELRFAYDVLEDVPMWARSELLAYDAQSQRLHLLTRAQDVGVFVPAERASERWWENGPHLLGERLRDGQALGTWMAGRVEDIDDLEVHLAVAVIRGRGQPVSGTMSILRDDFLRLCADVGRATSLAVGQFVEIGYYRPETDPLIRVMSSEPWTAGLQTQLDPARFLRRARWI